MDIFVEQIIKKQYDFKDFLIIFGSILIGFLLIGLCLMFLPFALIPILICAVALAYYLIIS